VNVEKILLFEVCVERKIIVNIEVPGIIDAQTRWKDGFVKSNI